MNRTIRLLGPLLLCLTLAACQQSGPPQGAPDSPPQTPPPSVTGLRWSDPASWPQGRLPQAGEAVTIPSGTTLLLDVSPPPLAGLTIDGTLVFDHQDLQLSANWIMVHGKLEIGSSSAPFAARAVITLTGPDQDVMGMGGKVLGVMGGGVVQLYGEARTPWTRLAASARPGDTVLNLQDAPDWRPGERIVVASTDFAQAQAETFVIVRVEGTRVWLERPVTHLHWGEALASGAVQRAEVALLSRGVLVQGDAASEAEGFGGHLMVMAGGQALLHGAEFYRMGQRARQGRYPVHWHLLREGAAGSYLVGSSVHHSFNRCVTIHGSSGVLVADTLAYHAPGHCFFLEDGAETGNRFVGNLGLGTYAPEPQDALLPSDRDFPGPATYWITNPDNSFVGNVAAGSDGTGFWLALPQHPTGASFAADVWPRFTPLREFRGNVAHSNGVDGLHVDRAPRADPADGLEVAYYRPSLEPGAVVDGRNSSPTVRAVFEDFSAYKNRNRGVWLRGEDHLLLRAVLSDNAVGASFAGHRARAEGGLFVGETENVGSPAIWERDQGRVGARGRALPRPWQPDYALRGFEFYDGVVGVEESRFAGYAPNPQRPAAALSYLDFTAYAVHPGNFARALSFAPGTQPVYLARRAVPEPGAVDDAGEDGYRSALFVDQDGSVSGAPGSAVVADTPLLVTAGCRAQPEWNAQVCPGRYAALTLSNVDPEPLELSWVTLTRSGSEPQAVHTMLGTPRSGPNTQFRSLLPLGYSYRYALGGPLPGHLRLHLADVTPSEHLRVTLPYPENQVFIYRDWWVDPRSALAVARSLADLETSSGEAYYLEGGLLHLKLQVRPGQSRDWAALEVCQTELCAP